MKNKEIISVLIAALCISAGITNTAFAENINIAGSEPMIPIVKVLADNFAIANPNTTIDVKGGTTDFGFEELKKGTIEIANASARIQPPDILTFVESGRKQIELILAQDNICVMVNNANTINSLTLEEVKNIYIGKIKNWKALGGTDLPITLYGRELYSAQARFFMTKLEIPAYDTSMKQGNDRQEAVLLKDDPSGIAFVSLAYAKSPGIKALPLSPKKGFQPLDPFNQEINKRGIYPLTRKLYQYTTQDKLTPEVKAFLDFEFSPWGQAIIAANGVWPATPDEIEANLRRLRSKQTIEK